MKSKIVLLSLIFLSLGNVFAKDITEDKKINKIEQNKKEKNITTIYNKNGKIVLELKESDLSSYKQISFNATTPWYPKIATFSGISFKDVLIKSGIDKNSTLIVTAWDKFKSEIPASDAFEYNTILTTHVNGERITLKNKGPLFVMYPMDEIPELKNSVYYNRSVWQIKEIRERK